MYLLLPPTQLPGATLSDPPCRTHKQEAPPCSYRTLPQKSFSIPIVGSFELQLSDIVVTRFSANASNSRLQILDGFFHLLASDVAANLTFKWHWAKAGLSGSGDGELLLGGGTIDWVFDVHKVRGGAGRGGCLLARVHACSL